MSDHYSVLGVRRRATDPEIKAAYRALALKLHPDVDPSPDAREKFIRLQEAYEVLSDPPRRENYNAVLDYEETLRRQKEELEAARAHSQFSRTTQFATEASKQESPRSTAVKGEDILKLSLLMKQSRHKDAEALAQTILKVDPRAPLAYAALGDIYRFRGDLKKASQNYAFAAQFDPQNPSYIQRQIEMEEAISTGRPQVEALPEGPNLKPFVVVGGMLICMAAYPAISREPALLPGLGPINRLTLGHFAMLLLSGLTIGCGFSIGDIVDRFQAAQKSALNRTSPAMILLAVAMVNFWLAGILYVAVGSFQQSFSASISRVMAACAAVTIAFALIAIPSSVELAGQLFLWGGGLAYLGAILGWSIADGLRR